jgi:hypothetical protein
MNGYLKNDMPQSPPPILLNYTPLRRPLPRGILALALPFCVACPLAWFISLEATMLGPRATGCQILPFKFWISLALDIALIALLHIQIRTLIHQEQWSARFMAFAHLAIAVFSIWFLFSVNHTGWFEPRAQLILQGLFIFTIAFEVASALLHWNWAQELGQDHANPIQPQEPIPPNQRPSAEPQFPLWTAWRRLPTAARWPLAIVAFVAIAYIEFICLLLGIGLIFS